MKMGLSPRVRGNHSLFAVGELVDRSIPACAGEPNLMQLISSKVKVYPRVCGGTECPLVGNKSDNGLSPRVRGNL